ncbi:MAG TPA: pterin-binding protein [Nitrospiraceae bacterium]|jgi:5-methyltetrahydrofolate--homocysteine methyltransferase|nr:pterin-binding protein [Nitrospiraceae bacterium]
MQTTLQSEITQVTIQSDGPIIIIGEKINPTGHKRLAKALQTRNFEYVRSAAAEQVAAGADVLDINVSVPGLDDIMLLPEVVKVVASRVGVPLCVDSPNPKAMAAALAVAPGKPLANSVNGQGSILREMLPIVKDRGAAVIGLTMDDKGIPNNPYERLAIAGRILEHAARIAIPPNDVVIDPLVMTVGADQKAGKVTLKTIDLIRRELGVNMILGASNVSFGLPSRNTVNQAFLALAAGEGASCVITDPIKFTAIIRATDLLRGHDPYAKRYISYYRSHSGRTREETSLKIASQSMH